MLKKLLDIVEKHMPRIATREIGYVKKIYGRPVYIHGEHEAPAVTYEASFLMWPQDNDSQKAPTTKTLMLDQWNFEDEKPEKGEVFTWMSIVVIGMLGQITLLTPEIAREMGLDIDQIEKYFAQHADKSKSKRSNR